MRIDHQINSALSGLCGLVNAIQRFNQDYSSFGKAKDVFSQALRFSLEDRDAELSIGKFSVDQSDNAAIQHSEKIFRSHLGVINKLGINIELNRSRVDAESLREEFPEQIKERDGHSNALRPDSLELGIVDEQKLLDFFRSLKIVDIRDEEVKKTLMSVAHELDRNIIRSYIHERLGREQEQAHKIFSLADEISSELRRLGLMDAAQVLSRHLEHAWQGSLSELLIADQAQILPGIGFRPHSWHEDCSLKYYAPRWENALSALEQVAENSKADSLFREAYQYLRESIDRATEHFSSVERSGDKSHYQFASINEFKEILSQASLRLDNLSWRIE